MMWIRGPVQSLQNTSVQVVFVFIIPPQSVLIVIIIDIDTDQ